MPVEIHVTQPGLVETTRKVPGNLALQLEVRKEDFVGMIHEFAGLGSFWMRGCRGAIGAALAVEQLPRRLGGDGAIAHQLLADDHGLQLVAEPVGEVFR